MLNIVAENIHPVLCIQPLC